MLLQCASRVELNVEITSEAMSCLTLTDFFGIAVICYVVLKQKDQFFTNMDRRLIITAHGLLERLLSSVPSSINQHRPEALATLIRAVSALHSANSDGRDVLTSILTILLIFRLREGPSTEWQVVDDSLCDCLRLGCVPLCPQNTVIVVLELILRKDRDVENQQLIVSSSLFILSYGTYVVTRVHRSQLFRLR